MGQIQVGGTPIGCTLELPWNLNRENSSSIPSGTYTARLKIRPNGTRAIEILNVPGDRTDILIHVANVPRQLKGCIAPGKACGKDSIKGGQSGPAMKQILDIIDSARRVDAATDDATDIVVRIR
jgi:hypothetical protein